MLMAQAIDRFLESDTAKRNGMFSRSDFVTRVLSQWFAEHEKEFDMFVPRELRTVKGKGGKKHESYKPIT
jgi:hypothetical protein